MEYDEIPEPDGFDANKDIVIYEDIDGNLEIDRYFWKEDAEWLKKSLLGKFKNVYYCKYPESFEVNRPFRYGKPFLKKRSEREVDWNNEEVIVVALNSTKNSKKTVEHLVELSGKVAVADSQATGFTLDARYRHIDFEFQKWKREQKKIENTENRLDLCKEFAKVYIAMQKKKRQKHIDVGTKVKILDDDTIGKIIEYDGSYRIEDEEGFSGRYNRNEFEVIQ